MFGSEVKIEGKLGKVLPITGMYTFSHSTSPPVCVYDCDVIPCVISPGPQPDWDPDIVAGLDNPDCNFDVDDQLQDDFVLQVYYLINTNFLHILIY